MQMNITTVDVRLEDRPESIDGRLKAIATITFDFVLTVNDIKVIQAKNRLCIMFPQNKNQSSIVVPRIREFSKTIEDTIINCYLQKVNPAERIGA